MGAKKEESTATTPVEKVKGLYPKLLEIQRRIIGLEKDRNTKSQQNPNGYAYVTGTKVLSFIKPLMNEYGLLLKQEVGAFTNERQDYKTKFGEKSEILTKVDMVFTWVDAETGEKDVNLFGSNGMNDWEKGFGSALTYGERYFLLKYFHIATDEDDIDNPDRVTSPSIPESKEEAKKTTKPAEAKKEEAETKEPAKSGTPAAGIQPSKEFSEGTGPADSTQKASEDPRKVKAKEAFKNLDQPSALKYIIQTLGLKKFSTVDTFVDASSIEEVEAAYKAIVALNKTK